MPLILEKMKRLYCEISYLGRVTTFLIHKKMQRRISDRKESPKIKSKI
jgi:hypothetical protein